jgi:hypothetical protein
MCHLCQDKRVVECRETLLTEVEEALSSLNDMHKTIVDLHYRFTLLKQHVLIGAISLEK